MHTWPSPVKLWSHGPAFRAENVQRGRFRQFHQVNLEIVGTSAPVADAEAIALFVDVLRELGLEASASPRVRSATPRTGSATTPTCARSSSPAPAS
jgi:histidyl-tRNA synthetase